MINRSIFWFHPQTPQNWHQQMNHLASGVADEKIIADYISCYLPLQKKIIIDLGIGTGRELSWLDKVSGIERIIGIDSSKNMLSFCRTEVAKCVHKIELVQDDLLRFKKLPKIVNLYSNPVVYISVLNTFGNFDNKERLIALKNIASLLKKGDRMVVVLYKRNQRVESEQFLKLADSYTPKNDKDKRILAELVEYGLTLLFWPPILDKYHQLPRFWYDKKSNDVIVHVDGKRLLISHRFSKGEIEEEFKEAGLEVDRIIEGKAMYIAVGKKLV